MRLGRNTPRTETATGSAERGTTRPRYELLEGDVWRGDYATRRAAMAEAELLAAERGQTINWVRLSEAATIGTPRPAGGDAAFTVRVRADASRLPDGSPLPRAPD